MGWLLVLALWQEPEAERPKLLLVSVDGLQGCAADRLGEISPTLAELRAAGRAWDLDSCTPAMTHPGHVTLISGRDPEQHHIFFNEFGMRCVCVTGHGGRDYADWFPESAVRAGFQVSAFGWAEVLYMRGLLRNVPYDPSVHQRDNDEAQTGRAVEEIRRNEADVVILYLAYFDKIEHERGPLVLGDGSVNQSVLDVLRQTDARIGRVVAAARETWGERARIAVASDHGFTTGCDRCATCAGVEAAVTRGANRFDGSCCEGRCFTDGCQGHTCPVGEGVWYVRGQGMIAFFAPRGVEDVSGLIEETRATLPEGYVLHIPDGGEGNEGRRSGFLFSVHPPENHSFSRGEGVHGHEGSLPSMRCELILWGAGQGETGRGAQRDVAPTLADLLGFELPSATGRSLLPEE